MTPTSEKDAAALIAEWQESKRQLAELEAGLEQMKREHEEERAALVKRQTQHREFIQISRHDFADGPREGNVALGMIDPVIVRLIEKRVRPDDMDTIRKYLDGLRSADTDTKHIANLGSYYWLALHVVIADAELDLKTFSIDDIYADPYRPAHIAMQLSLCLVEHERALEKSEIGDWPASMSALAYAATHYHRMVMALVDRQASAKTGKAAASGIDDSIRTAVLRACREYAEARDGDMTRHHSRMACAAIEAARSAGHPEDDLPVARTVIDWAKASGIISPRK